LAGHVGLDFSDEALSELVFWLEQRDEHCFEVQIHEYIELLKFNLLFCQENKGRKHIDQVRHHLVSSLDGLLDLGANYELANHLSGLKI